jgi:hypothetical protein
MRPTSFPSALLTSEPMAPEANARLFVQTSHALDEVTWRRYVNLPCTGPQALAFLRGLQEPHSARPRGEGHLSLAVATGSRHISNAIALSKRNHFPHPEFVGRIPPARFPLKSRLQ